MDLNYIKYPGNKIKLAPIILHEINKYKDLELFELFGGSGAISLNAQNKSHLNDLDHHIYDIHFAFKFGKKKQLDDILKEVKSYGDPRNIKEDYYLARNEMNLKYYNDEDPIIRGFYYYVISTFAINSMMRFGPSGFNQSFGKRGVYSFDLKTFALLKERYKNIELYNTDYISFNDKNGILFADPPYVDMSSGIYDFNDSQYSKFLTFILDWDGPVIYTDILSEERLDLLGTDWTYKILRDNCGVGKTGKNKTYKTEAMYCNFKLNTITAALF